MAARVQQTFRKGVLVTAGRIFSTWADTVGTLSCCVVKHLGSRMDISITQAIADNEPFWWQVRNGVHVVDNSEVWHVAQGVGESVDPGLISNARLTQSVDMLDSEVLSQIKGSQDRHRGSKGVTSQPDWPVVAVQRIEVLQYLRFQTLP